MKRFLLLLLIFTVSCASLGSGKQQGSFSLVSEKDEYYIGRLTAAKILKKYPLLHNDRLTEYLTDIASYLAIYSKRPFIYRGYHAGVLNTEKPMALSTPGGFILISKGLIKKLDNEDQLAAVIAHEIGHISNKHGLSYIKTAYLVDLGATLSRKIAKRKIEKERSQKLLNIAVDVADVLLKRGYSRKQEEEADKEAIRILKKSGYNPYALIEVLEKMKKISRNAPIQFTRTHPIPERRIEILKKVATRKKPSQKRTFRFQSYKNML